MRIRMTNSGKSARNETVNDLKNAVNEIDAAITELNKCPGLGAPLYIKRLEDLKKRYSNLKNQISRMG